ncbi:MAG: NUDIX domain-containing protein [Chloroflexota bacterium]
MSEERKERAFNLITRALIIQDEHLLVSRWQGSYCFPVGGRIEPGETLEQAVRREVREETGVEARMCRLVYFNENFFLDATGSAVHELGWYFWVKPERPIGRVGETRPHPDSPHLRLEYVALDGLSAAGLVPPFLAEILADDYRRRFDRGLRHVLSYDRPGREPEIHLLNEASE